MTTSGRSESIGYDFVDGSDPPVWMIWMGDEVLFINPSDSSASALLDAFRDEVKNIMDAKSDFDSSDRDANTGLLTMIFEGFGIAGGTVTGIIGCAGVPLTFWAAGGSGWVCAGGISAAVGSGGAFIITFRGRQEALEDRRDARRELDRAIIEAGELFQALKQRSIP